jgi:transposase-like protein
MEIRKVIYTINAIESLNRSLRKVIKTKAVFPDEDSVFKLMYLALNNISKRWRQPILCLVTGDKLVSYET